MVRDVAARFFLAILERLNEAQMRWCVAREALAHGRGGVTRGTIRFPRQIKALLHDALNLRDRQTAAR